MENYTFTQEENFYQAQRRVKSIKGFYIHATVYVLVNAFIIAGCALDNLSSLATSEPYLTAVFWGIGLFANGMAVFGQDVLLGKNWENKEIQKILRK